MKKNPLKAMDIKKAFAPVYRVIAGAIRYEASITSGLCLDIGAGGGYLGIEMARATSLEVILLDNSKDMVMASARNIAHKCLGERIRAVRGNVHCLPFCPDSINLVVSRGSLLFWEDKGRAFREIYRVLKPGGTAYVGGGFGSEGLLREIDTTMQAIDPEWRKNFLCRVEKTALDYSILLEKLGIPLFKIISSPADKWVIIKK